MFMLCICLYCTGLAFVWTNRTVLPPNGVMPFVAFLVLFLLGAMLYVHADAEYGNGRGQSSQRLSRRMPFSISSVLILLLFFLGWSYDLQTQELVAHPIDWLISKAEKQSNDWASQASVSQNLAECVQEYQRRYERHPPPGFDAWYRYATARNSVVIDDYDNMMEDLLPFWGISPAEIRLRTQQVISDSWNEVSEIIIRNGHAGLGPDFLPTHRWMLDGAINLVKDFSDYLPDMVIAFNLNDEPRVAVPYNDLQRLRDIGTGSPKHLRQTAKHNWSADRATTWHIPEDPGSTRPFEDHSRTNAFSAGTVACPPTSFAQRATTWDSSALCTSCAAPHSHGVFLSNWTLSASPCHQPDLRNLHGFYLSPAAFKPSHQLLPIFSQSKVHGYADILYPSPWNYMDKIYYNATVEHPDPPFADKHSTLFWRGATSEGVSRHGTWKGMTRQRLVHLANNLTTIPPSRSPTLPILLPNPQGKYTYQTLPHTTNPITALNLSLDIAIVDGIARAWDNDGAAQDAEFGFAPPTDFQDHWRYRYLMDVDGAAYSGRFLPFLQSRCVPFRAAIFRSWWDARLTAWKHFVPVDVRLHGLLSTLAYFTGMADPAGDGKGVVLTKGNAGAAEMIAEAGREWAGKVLRKEDMEIFMFRLLLEWGRLTDDRRDEIGFVA
ncbi:hypothetical protein IMSHALPRED_003385 [Imshaugia aleurites]|uniref:Glycosyl transferase CAP10 domain-containing protein n=1 Tax=Imshaugia aleurites TaxID=172621 RepID=A0A8H3J7F7_9LECA|nr:hypothetical protein IMSHALPRED_003385 [Imshaugia aleurites]